MNIPKYAKAVADKLINAGFEAYFVGGCVRDQIMGRTVNDYDITTNALPDDIKRIFSDMKIIPTGEKHGTMTIVSEGENIEVTTYRVDGEYRDSRHPESVSFTKNVTDDLARRDFTINAICYNKDFVDPFGGREDIERKLIRTVGNSDERFNEDALRIMRALRFASVLGFRIEEETKKSIHKNKQLLKNVSVERIFVEFSKLLCGKNVRSVLMEYVDVIGVFIPEILPCVGFEQKNEYHRYDVYEHIVRAVEASDTDLKIRLSVFFHDIAKPECFTIDEKGGHFKGHDEKSALVAHSVLRRLKADNETVCTVETLVREHQREILPEKKYVKRCLAKIPSELFDMLLKVKWADTVAHSDKAKGNFEVLNRIAELKKEIENEGECFSLKKLEVNGRDLTQMGFEGRKIGEILNMLLEKVIDGEVENKKEALIEMIKAL
ncbi:MAG: CCA tRNA nucleotidyltransferase [Clostridia bacterium]|nr:CCA tRNA nucleotidyltransferase [Clostridia bacterium]